MPELLFFFFVTLLGFAGLFFFSIVQPVPVLCFISGMFLGLGMVRMINVRF